MGQFQLLNSDRREPYGLLYQNIKSLITRNSKKKIDYVKEYTHEHGNETNEQSELLNTQTDMDHTPRKNDAFFMLSMNNFMSSHDGLVEVELGTNHFK